jgi:glycosyltransferase involved in cell wall biosynthesis
MDGLSRHMLMLTTPHNRAVDPDSLAFEHIKEIGRQPRRTVQAPDIEALSPDVVFVEDNYTLWESYLQRSSLPQDVALVIRENMLNGWYALSDMYAHYLGRRGIKAVRCVPSFTVSSPAVSMHRLGHPVVRIPIRGGKSSGLREAFSFNRGLGHLFKAHRPRVVHFHNFYSSYFVLSPLGLGSSALAVQYTGGEPPSRLGPGEVVSWLAPLRFTLKRTDGLLLGDFSAEEVRQRRILSEYYRVSPSHFSDFPVVAVDTDLFYQRDKQSTAAVLGFDNEAVNVLVVSSVPNPATIGPLSKNPFAVLEMFARNRRSRVRWHLHFIGFGPGFADLASRVKELRLEDRVTLHGMVDHEQLPLFYAASDVVVNPYRSLDLRVGTATMEAFACARPVIMFKRSSHLETTQAGGFLIGSDDEIVSVIADGDRLVAKGREGAAIAPRFALSGAGLRLLEIYHTMTN